MAEYRRCCEVGCPHVMAFGIVAGLASPPPSDWYRVVMGASNWACPDHAAVWRAFDQQRRVHDEVYSAAVDAVIAAFEEQYERENPYPTRDFQPSPIDAR